MLVIVGGIAVIRSSRDRDRVSLVIQWFGEGV